MACATLKRSLDFDPLLHDHHKSPKRQRCAPMAVSPTPPSAAASSASAATASSSSKVNQNSPFGDVHPPMTNVMIAAKLQAELKRMQRRRQIKTHNRQRTGNADPNHQDSSSGSDSEPEMMAASFSSATSVEANRVTATAAILPKQDDATPSSQNRPTKDQNDTPLFNFKQVSLICERLVREREEALREEYDKVLTNKLAEQYDAFVKFTYDQIQRRLNDRPMSYVS